MTGGVSRAADAQRRQRNLPKYSPLRGDHGFLSQNFLAQLRNLVEWLIVRAHLRDPSAEFHYDRVRPALEAVKAKARFRLLSRLHGLRQASASHYTLGGDLSERFDVYYSNCSAARAAGVAPLYVGDPGYRSGLDRDHGGIACE